MDNKYRKFYIDWWNVKKSTVFGLIVAVLSLSLLFGGGWWLYRNDFFLAKTDNAVIPKDSARIVAFEGDVRIVRASTRETILVTKETYVSAGDTVQTQADGRAQIRMIDGSTLSVRPNSTVVIRDSASIFGGTNVRVTLDDGQINVKTQQQAESSENVVEVMESENRLQAETDASFNINPQTNGGEIRISRGGVESNTGGEKTLIGENEFATVSGGKIANKEPLLEAPKLVAPLNADQITASEVSFRWQKPEAASALNFQIQVSGSPFFAPDSMLADREALSGQIFSLPNLAPGVYYWHVRAVSASGQSSDWSEPWKLTVVKQTTSAAIPAGEWQIDALGGNIYRIKGRTQPGATVRIAGRETFAAADGSFLLQVSSASPAAIVEISDDKGNRTRYNLNLKTGQTTR
jgi:hypothetical protein